MTIVPIDPPPPSPRKIIDDPFGASTEERQAVERVVEAAREVARCRNLAVGSPWPEEVALGEALRDLDAIRARKV